MRKSGMNLLGKGKEVTKEESEQNRRWVKSRDTRHACFS
jgi:hypothetical protein